MKDKRYKPSSFELAEMASASAALHMRGHHPSLLSTLLSYLKAVTRQRRLAA